MTNQLSFDTSAQRCRLLAALRQGPVTTLEARRELDILMPATRVFELRHKGYNIVTTWVFKRTDAGVEHKVARYALLLGQSDAQPV